MTKKQRVYIKEEFEDIAKISFSIFEMMRKMNMPIAGGNYRTIKKYIKEFGIDTSHFTGQGHLKGKTHDWNTRLLEEMLIDGKSENSYALKNRLFRDNIKTKQCEICKLTHYNDNPLTLDLHHIDGNHNNNTLINLQILCSNCHAQTDNFRGKNQARASLPKKKRIVKSRAKPILIKKPRPTKANYPPVEELVELIKVKPARQLAKEFGVTDSAFRKYCETRNIVLNNHEGKEWIKSANYLPKEEMQELVNTLPMTKIGKMFGVSDNAVKKYCKRHGIILK